MSKIIDVRGLACPQPVINTKKALEGLQEDVLTVIVDNVVSRDNVRRFAESQGCTVNVEGKGGDYHLHVAKGFVCETAHQSQESQKGDDIIVYINSEMMGKGDDKLGRILMQAFFKTLVEPRKLIFVNSGVKLVTEGSEVIEEIQELQKRGVEVLACGTCLEFYGLKEKLHAGVVSNMYDIVNSLMEASKVIQP